MTARGLLLAAAVVAVALCAPARRAAAYPQYQLAKDQTCSGCHLSPAGGGLLNENGLTVAESASTFGGAPEAAHGALVGPGWLTLGGDLRVAAGGIRQGGIAPFFAPMQAELYGRAQLPAGLSAYATVGSTRGNEDSPITWLGLREHYVQWQPEAGATTGLFVRAGRFMPVYGLRLAEHTAYTRRYGQVPLGSEAYGASASYVEPGWELHATGFVHDGLRGAIERGNGGALYAEKRLGEVASIGVQGRYAKATDDARAAGGLTGKYWLEGPALLLSAEVAAVHQAFAAGGARNQVVSYLLASWFPKDGWLVDLGVGQFDEDVKVAKVDREAVDLNVHWMTTSHLELVLMNRVQTIGLGGGGATSGWSMLMLHYRL